MLQAQPLELLFGLVPEHMTPGGPESSDGLPDRLVLGAGFLVHETGVRDLALGRGLGEVDLLVGDAGELGQAEALGESVDAGVAQEGDAVVVWAGNARVVFHRVAADCGEVVALVDVFEHGGAGVDVVVGELNATGPAWGEAFDLGLEVGCLDEKALVGGEGGLVIACADCELYDGGTKETIWCDLQHAFREGYI